jgi:protein-L-isoaspartate(D-aspartate) O-methyltransferase
MSNNDSSKGKRGGQFPLKLDRVSAPSARRLVNPDQVVPPGVVGRKSTPAASPAVKQVVLPAHQQVLRPQRPVSEAARDQLLARTPSGLGLDSAGVRRRMVERLQQGGIQEPRVLAAMNAVERHAFVDTALVGQAYEDTSLPIGLGQTISKPSSVARMIELLCLRSGATDQARPLGRVLEIGTGCGYQAAVLTQLARQVVSIERLKPLHEKARQNLRALHLDNLRLVYGDGMLGHGPNAPYDCIIAAAGGQILPPAWLDQLAPGGRLVAPMEDARSGGQSLVIVDRLPDGQLVHSTQEAVHFVPLKSGVV